MEQPFEVPFADVEANIEIFVDSVFASLRSEFLLLGDERPGQEATDRREAETGSTSRLVMRSAPSDSPKSNDAPERPPSS